MEEIKTLDIEKFSPPVAELKQIVSETQLVTLDDLGDSTQLKVVKDNRIVLKNARVKITKYGKMLRQDALTFQRGVIAKEKELIAIIEPEENRLAELENNAEEYIERKKRIELIPQRRERLAELDDEVKVSDEELISMNGSEFQGFCNKVLADKNERERLKVEEEREQIEKEKARLAREIEIKEAEDRARLEERGKADRERKEREEEAKNRIAREESEAKERIARQEQEAKEKIEREEREREERFEMERKKDKRYQAFLKEYNYVENSDDFYLVDNYPEIRLYKIIGTFNRDENN